MLVYYTKQTTLTALTAVFLAAPSECRPVRDRSSGRVSARLTYKLYQLSPLLRKPRLSSWLLGTRFSYHLPSGYGPYFARIRPPVHRNHLRVPDSPDGNPNCCGRQFLAPAVTTLSPTMLIQSLRRLCGMDTISRQRLGGWSFPFKPLWHQSSCLHGIVCKSA